MKISKITDRKFGLFILFLLLASCGYSDEGYSDEEKKIIKTCQESASRIDAYDETGKHYSKTTLGRRAILEVCAAKAELYVDGYRISKEFHVQDIRVYTLSVISEKRLTSIYKEAIKDGAKL